MAGGEDSGNGAPAPGQDAGAPTGSTAGEPEAEGRSASASASPPGDTAPEEPPTATAPSDGAVGAEAPEDGSDTEQAGPGDAPVQATADAASADAASADAASADEASAPPEAPSGEPAAPPAPAAPDGDGAAATVDESESRTAIVARSTLLAALIGAALVFTAQFAGGPEWLVEFLRHNDIEMPQRMALLYSAVGGATLAALLNVTAVVLAARRRVSLSRVEQVMWFASPLLALPFLPLLFEDGAWRNRHNALLPAILLVALGVEVLTFQSLRAVPDRVRGWFEWLRDRTPGVLRRHAPLTIVLGAALFYAIFMSFFVLRWHFKLQTHVFDLAINNNLLYGGLKGVFMQSPVVDPNEPARYLATHAKYGCYLFLPIYALYPRAETLIVLQATLLGFGAVPLFAFARRHISPGLAVVVALAYVCYYPMHGANYYEVKWVPVASFFLLTVIWAADARRWVICAIAFVWALLLREDIPIALAVIGGFLVATGHRPRAGLTMALVATAWFVFVRFFLMEQAGDWWFPKMYKGLWAPGENSFGSVIKTLLTNPLYVWDKILEERKVFYVLHLMVPMMFLPARRWYLWAAFIPGFILTLMTTDYKPPTMYSFQYVMYWTPFIFPAAVLALASIERRSADGRLRARAAVAAMALASAVLTFNYGAFPARNGSLKGGYTNITFDFSEEERERYANLRELMELIPDEASVAATERVGAHLSSRTKMYSMRKGPHDADYIVAWSKQLGLARTRPELRKAVKSRKYGVVQRLGDLALLKRGHDPAGNAQLLRDWKL